MNLIVETLTKLNSGLCRVIASYFDDVRHTSDLVVFHLSDQPNLYSIVEMDGKRKGKVSMRPLMPGDELFCPVKNIHTPQPKAICLQQAGNHKMTYQTIETSFLHPMEFRFSEGEQ